MALAPSVESGAFSFAGDSLFVRASGNNLHRRAMLPELHAHFDGAPGAPKDYPGHWYEAQLVHYGLPPSKTKGTAKMRLFDALKKGSLAVPASLVSMESNLRKAWKAQQRESQKPAKGAAAPVTTANRKAPSSSSSAKPRTAATGARPAPPTAKKRKAPSSEPTQLPSKKPSRTSNPASKPPPAKKAKRQTAPSTSRDDVSPSAPTPAASSYPKKQTARRGKPWTPKAGSTSRGGRAAPSAGTPRGIQTARRGGHRAIAGRAAVAPPSQEAGYEDPPPSYAEATGTWSDDERDDYQDGDEEEEWYQDSHQDDEDDEEEEEEWYQDSHSGALRPTGRRLGLLNGRYDVTCTSEGFPGQDRAGQLVLTLDRDELWGQLDIGDVRGVIRLRNRPYEAAEEHLSVDWRGLVPDDWGRREPYDSSRASPVQWLAFPGDGEVRGSVQYGPARGDYFTFEGFRVSGEHETRSEISPAEMRSNWAQLG